MKTDKSVSRREFIQRISIIGVAGAGAGSLLAGCGGGGGEAGGDQAAQEQQGGGESACADVSGLTEQEVQARETLQYVNQTPHPDRRCDNCQFWVAPEGGAPCGGCQILAGPIDPAGFCNSWAPQMA